MSGGWYKQLRNIPERPWFKDANVVLLYTFLKATAYVADGKYRDVIVRRGSCPTTRAEMMEATGLSYKQVDICLRRLIGYNEILVKGYNKFSIVTICDYDACDNSNTLFDDYEEQQRYNKGTAKGTTKEQQKVQQSDFTPIIYNIKEERREEDTLISNSIPYKKERENNDVALEVKKRYNKEFNGMLPPCIRLSTSTRIAVEECLRRFGMQSVDTVFAQIKTEKFSLGNNKTGFIANFTFIFTLKNYQQYLERAQLARQKKESHHNSSPSFGCAVAELQSPEPSPSEKRKQLLLDWIAAEEQHPTARGQDILITAYDNGEMAELNIDWKPNNE